MRRQLLLCVLVLLVGCVKELPPPPAPSPPSAPAPDPYFVYRVEHDGVTLGDIARWYTGKYGNWQILTKPINPDLTQCCAKLDVGREVKIPRHLMVRTDPMPAPKKTVSKRGKRPKATTSPKATEEAPAQSDDSGAGSEEPAPSESEAPPPAIIGPK
jgi:hypothetical protein